MPLYAYLCPACRHRFDELQTVERSTRPTACPECGRPAERQLCPAALRFIGDGWTVPSSKEPRQ